MFDKIINLWTDGGLLGKGFCIYAVVMLLATVCFVYQNLKDNPKKRLDFITKANKEGNMAVGKLTCLTVHGRGMPEQYHVEYMYVVDGKQYFVTYEMAYKLDVDDEQESVNPNMLLNTISKAMILFFDKKNPKKVLSKFEVFTSYDAIHQIDTPKENVWRDIDKNWTEPMYLVKY